MAKSKGGAMSMSNPCGKYRFLCRPAGALSRVATKAALSGPIDADTAREARETVKALMAALYPPGGEWRMWLWNGGRQLQSETFQWAKDKRQFA